MMVDDVEEGQLKGPIDVLVPYNSAVTELTSAFPL